MSSVNVIECWKLEDSVRGEDNGRDSKMSSLLTYLWCRLRERVISSREVEIA